jgi:hypothetical protein
MMVQTTDRARRQGLSQILWLGGPPDGGKTSIAQILARKWGLQVYHFDRHEPAHFARADPQRHPALYAAHPDRLDAEARWLGSTPEEMARDTLASWTERAAMACDDLLGFPTMPRVIAEGPGFFPAALAPLLADPRQAVWLLPTEEFKRASVARREKLAGVPVSDLLRARENLIARDLLMGQEIAAQCNFFGLTLLLVDGSADLATMADRVAAHFAPFLHEQLAEQE